MSQRHFDESEIGPILQRAAELQAGAVSGSAGGFTLDELQRLATEVGIDPVMVERAVGELAKTPTNLVDEGGTDSLRLEQTVAGSLDDEAWEEIVADFRLFARRPGITKQRGTTTEWMCRSDAGVVTFTATRRGPQTRFRLIGDMGKAVQGAWTAAAVCGTLAIVVGVKMVRLGSDPLLAFLLAAGIVAIGALGTHLFVRTMAKQAASRLRAIFERATRSVQDSPVLESTISGGAEDTLIQRLQ